MNTTTAAPVVGVDLAKNVFELAVADGNWRITARARLTRSQFERWFQNRQVGLVVMEACGSAHHWARWLTGLGIQVKLLPARYVRAYVKRNKTDAADAAALLEAARCAEIVPVRVKSLEQQALQALHRSRSLWMATRTSRINALRGFCREFGMAVAQGSRVGVEQIGRVLADPQTPIPGLLRGTMTLLVEEIRLLEGRITQLERELTAAARQSPACATLLSVPGGHRPAHRHGDGGCHRRQRQSLQGCPPLRLLVRADTEGALLGPQQASGPDLQTRRPVPAHAADARGQIRAPSRQCGQRRRQARRCPAPVGGGGAKALEPQQGHLRACQQAGPYLLRHVARPGALRCRAPDQKARARRLRDAGLKPPPTNACTGE
jgi:hypothetical protein